MATLHNLLILMGILGFVGFPYPALKDPAWHAALKIIVGLIAMGRHKSARIKPNLFIFLY